MAEKTAIEWCDSTFNPWIGCTPVSLACDDCYAARSTPARTLGVAWGTGQPRHRTSEGYWELPERWQRQAAAFQAQHGRRRRVFCASLGDVFDNKVPDAWRVDLFSQIEQTPDLDWLLLTKRIGNAARMLPWSACSQPWPHVWIGATVANQAEVNRDVPKLLATPARVRFLSVEPMLGRIDLEAIPFGPPCTGCGLPVHLDVLTGSTSCLHACDGPQFTGIDWVICGGESGPHARPMHPDWARSLRDQCAAAGVPFLFKQWGEWLPPYAGGVPHKYMIGSGLADLPVTKCENAMMTRVGKKAAGRLLDGRTHDEFPA